MKPIIDPIDRDLIIKELIPDRFVRTTNKGNNQIYIITAHNAPNTMREIGRIRELSFRLSGGGCGEELDVDEFDYMEKPYKQLIVWNPQDKEILGGYRYLHGQDWKLKDDGQPKIVTEHMFSFSAEFIKDYMPYTIDLGRAFIHPDYQSTKKGAKSIFAFDNLWDGLLVLTFFEPEVRYVIGKVTVYQNYDETARNAIFYFMNHYLGDKRGLMKGRDLCFDQNTIVTPEIRAIFKEKNIEEDYASLLNFIRQRGLHVPPLINSYFKLSSKMKVFGTGINREFGDILDTGIMIAVKDINQEKIKRHVDSFMRDRDKKPKADEIA